MATPKPTPTALKLVKGNPGKRPINIKEPKPKRGVPKCPSHIDAKAKTAWKKLCQRLDDMGVLTLADEYALEILVSIYARIRDLQKVIKGYGKTTYITLSTQGDEVVKAYPEVSQLEKAESLFRSYLTEFGLTPSARAKLQTEDKDEGDDPLDKYGV
ncbi:phage terminase small subunit P27 family [Psychrosphaera sp. 1_MG-2023]|uniref:phage terminase small subunit P27 family n=1 Tax=Psychrosphaera sp. 1_MG-2023 TaxID=3062643 RepID=UPI0026E2B9D5|nr:phage terminase small subunit P27 family [Psychrosphaera sp. 1_MG-2023]MDO6718824.1 phage terminase small subunit P27 family [Psychrosphaera sp. 1_MG-2023]